MDSDKICSLSLFQDVHGIWWWNLANYQTRFLLGEGGESKTLRKALKAARHAAKRMNLVIGYVYMDRRDTKSTTPLNKV